MSLNVPAGSPTGRPHHRSLFLGALHLPPVLVLVLALAWALLPASAQAGPHSSVSAAVTLGDSFISGEAGRWQGNSPDPTLCRRGTDRACTLDATTGLIPSYDTSSVL